VHYMDASQSIHFARVDFRNDGRVFGIKDEDRVLHVYVIGKTGTGKSTHGRFGGVKRAPRGNSMGQMGQRVRHG
jgi:hypothetical protein